MVQQSSQTPASLLIRGTVPRQKLSKRKRHQLVALTSLVCLVLFVFLNLQENHQTTDVIQTSTTEALVHYPGFPADAGDKLSDACRIARAVQRNPLHVSTYYPLPTVQFPTPETPQHISAFLCASEKEHDTLYKNSTLAREEHYRTGQDVSSIFAFKAARTGSTFFTTVIKNTIQKTKRPTSLYWEPFVGVQCQGPSREPEKQASALHAILTKRCRRKNQCVPDFQCVNMPANEFGRPWFVAASNPRFFNIQHLDWSRVFQGIDAHARIFALRRTNLVLLAYSKFHWQPGCVTDEHTTWDKKGNTRFTFDTMLRCIEHYGIGDQEISSSVAYKAAIESGSGYDPYLVVYEDVLANGLLVQQGILRHLGLDDLLNGTARTSMFQDNAGHSKKLHTKQLCQYKDVNCSELKDGLGNSEDKYPCLWKQLTSSAGGQSGTWTVPVLSNGTISIHGDCHSLEPLNEERPIRFFRELYSLETAASSISTTSRA